MAPTVLVAETDHELCHLYRRFFAHHGWQVHTFGGAVECLAQLRRGLPHFLILDVQLAWGGADGLLDVLRSDPTLARVPVLLTSTAAFPEDHSPLVSPPVVGTLEKPFSLTALLKRMRSELGTGQQEWREEPADLAWPRLCS